MYIRDRYLYIHSAKKSIRAHRHTLHNTTHNVQLSYKEGTHSQIRNVELVNELLSPAENSYAQHILTQL